MTPHHHDGELRALAGHPVLELTPSEIHTADLCVEVVRVTIFARELQHDYLVNVDVSPVVLGFYYGGAVEDRVVFIGYYHACPKMCSNMR